MKTAGAFFKKLFVIVFWLSLWALLACFIDKPLLLPGPWIVFRRLGELAMTTQFWAITARTLLRIFLGLLWAIPLGVLLAAGTFRFPFLRTLLSPLHTVIQSTPVASFILLLLIWVGRDILPSVIVALMVLPVIWRNVSAGAENTDQSLLEMAAVYRLSTWKCLKYIYAPSILPYFLAACRTGLGLAWKAGVAAEVLTVPKNSIGQMLYESKLYLETTDLFAWTVAVISCSLIIEKLLAAAIEHLALRCKTGGDMQ